MDFLYIIFGIFLSIILYIFILKKNNENFNDSPLLTNKALVYFLSIITSSVWLIIWFSYAWNDIKKVKKLNISPDWRAFFWYFNNGGSYFYLSDMVGKKRKSLSILLGITTTVLMLCIRVFSESSSTIPNSAVWGLLSFIILPFLVFPTITARNKIIESKNKSKKDDHSLPSLSSTESSSLIKYLRYFIIFIVAIVLVMALLSFMSGVKQRAGLSNTNPLNKLVTDTSWRDYTSTQFGFKASFPGNPKSSNSSIDIKGVSVPTTSYERDNGSAYYDIEIFDYPNQFDFSDIKASLEGGLNAAVEGSKDATLVDSNFAQFLGYTSINGTISVPNGEDTVTQYMTAFLKDNMMFLVFSSGSSSNDFSKFKDSFQFIK